MTRNTVNMINFKLLSPEDIVLLSALAALFLVQLFYLLRYYLRLARHRERPENPEQYPVTVILSVRNEEDRIRDIVEQLGSLSYPDYQILIINEFSDDNTLNILGVLAETHPRLKVTSLSQETRFSEKQAINIGLKGASSPWTVFVTSFAGKLNSEWLSGLNSLIDGQTDAVIAYTNLEPAKGWRNLLCRLERFNQFLMSGTRIVAGKPFVYEQTNILFRKSLYFDKQGFRHKLDREFANLELVFNENFRKERTKLTTNPALVVRENIKDNRGDYARLQKKGVQIRGNLPFAQRAGLLSDDLSRILLPALAVYIVIQNPSWWIMVAVLPLTCLFLQALTVKMLLNRLNERKIFLSSLVFMLIKPLINAWFFWSIHITHRRNKWK
jgi:glycosyltransferase involved in cell wall biosynthesis